MRDPEDYRNTTLTDGNPVTPDHRELKADGQQKGYVVLSAEERAKGFVRPLRHSYRHVASDGRLVCGVTTNMGLALCETYARDPSFYGETFCSGCRKHLPVAEFIWTEDGQRVGS